MDADPRPPPSDDRFPGKFVINVQKQVLTCVFAFERVVFYTSPVHQIENSQGSFHPMGHGAGQHPFTISLGISLYMRRKKV